MQALEAMAGISTGAVDKAREELQLEYARLFLTPGGLYPYESMYLGKEGHLMDEPYEQVRRFYLEQGTAVAPGQLHPEDHLAVELGFLAHLWSQDQVEAYYRFCRQHVLAWVPRCMEDLKAKTRSGWYQALADLVLAVLEIEAGTLLEVS
ncbi:MAG: molecular chaperone TorD family protein [Bacillota bacterium]